MTREDFQIVHSDTNRPIKSYLAFEVDEVLDRLEQRIAELEYQVKDNHDRAEEIIAAREKQIDRMHSKINELEAPKTCEGCKHHTYETEHYGLCHRNGFSEDTAYYWTCGGYEPKGE